MAHLYLFFVLLFFRLTAANIPSLALPSLNVSAQRPYQLSCAEGPVNHRRNVRAIDCLNLFTYILATTTDHTAPITYGLDPDQKSSAIVFKRESGTCGFFVGIGSSKMQAVPPPETTTLDVVLGVALYLVAHCLLDGKPDSTHWAGVGKWSPSSNVKISVAGLRPSGYNGGDMNETLFLNTENDD